MFLHVESWPVLPLAGLYFPMYPLCLLEPGNCPLVEPESLQPISSCCIWPSPPSKVLPWPASALSSDCDTLHECTHPIPLLLGKFWLQLSSFCSLMQKIVGLKCLSCATDGAACWYAVGNRGSNAPVLISFVRMRWRLWEAFKVGGSTVLCGNWVVNEVRELWSYP